MNELPEAIVDQNCENLSDTQKRKKLFGNRCNDCGSMPIYADDGIYVVLGRNRTENQEIITEKFGIMRKFLTDNCLSVNDGKT